MGKLEMLLLERFLWKINHLKERYFRLNEMVQIEIYF